MLGLNSQSGVKPAWPRLRDRTGNNWPPILLSQQWSYPRSTIRLSHAGQEAAETSGLSLQRDHPFWSMSDAVCPWHSRGARVGVSAYTTQAHAAYHDTILRKTRPNAVIMQAEPLPSLTGFADSGASWSKKCPNYHGLDQTSDSRLQTTRTTRTTYTVRRPSLITQEVRPTARRNAANN